MLSRKFNSTMGSKSSSVYYADIRFINAIQEELALNNSCLLPRPTIASLSLQGRIFRNASIPARAKVEASPLQGGGKSSAARQEGVRQTTSPITRHKTEQPYPSSATKRFYHPHHSPRNKTTPRSFRHTIRNPPPHPPQ